MENLSLINIIIFISGHYKFQKEKYPAPDDKDGESLYIGCSIISTVEQAGMVPNF
jgi:hypothetical protein